MLTDAVSLDRSAREPRWPIMRLFELIILAAVALAAGCGEGPIPISIIARRADPGDEALIDEAVAMIGHSWERPESALVVTKIVLEDPSDDGALGGLAFLDKHKCVKGAVVIRDAPSIAHELGHVYGLRHNCDPEDCDASFCYGIRKCTEEDLDNIMNPFGGGFELSEEQLDTIDDNIRRQRRCRKRQ